MFRELWRKKVALVLIVALLLLFPAASIQPAQMLSKSLFLSIGIDRNDDGFVVGGIICVSQFSSEGGEPTKTVRATGNSINHALKNITTNEGRKVSLAHCNLIVLGPGLADIDVTIVLSTMLKQYEMSNSALLVCTDDDFMELLQTSIENNTGATAGLLETITAFNQESLLGTATTLDEFYKNYLRPASTAILSVVNLSSSKEQKTGEGDAEVDTEGDEGELESEADAGDPPLYNTRSAVIYVMGKQVARLTPDEVWAYSYLTRGASWLDILTGATIGSSTDTTILNNINDGELQNANATLHSKSKSSNIKIRLEKNRPIANIKINTTAELYHIIDPNSPHKYINFENNPPTKAIKTAFQQKLLTNCESLLQKIEDYNADILGLHDNFHRFNTKQYKKYFQNNTLQDFLKDLEFNIQTNIKIVV